MIKMDPTDHNHFLTLWEVMFGESYASLIHVRREDVEALERAVAAAETAGEQLLYEKGLECSLAPGSRKPRWRGRTAVIVNNPRCLIANVAGPCSPPGLHAIARGLTKLLGEEVKALLLPREVIFYVPARRAIVLRLPRCRVVGERGFSVKFEKVGCAVLDYDRQWRAQYCAPRA